MGLAGPHISIIYCILRQDVEREVVPIWGRFRKDAWPHALGLCAWSRRCRGRVAGLCLSRWSVAASSLAGPPTLSGPSCPSGTTHTRKLPPHRAWATGSNRGNLREGKRGPRLPGQTVTAEWLRPQRRVSPGSGVWEVPGQGRVWFPGSRRPLGPRKAFPLSAFVGGGGWGGGTLPGVLSQKDR